MDIRLRTINYDFNGKTYQLACNMNVLADVQEAFGGDLLAALNNINGIKSTLVFLTAMLNDSADTNGWSERYTAKEVGRMLSIKDVQRIGAEIFSLVKDAVSADVEEEQPDGVSEQTQKN